MEENITDIIVKLVQELSPYERDKNRRTGRTTRLVDKYIQEIFTSPIGTQIYLSDHHYTGVLEDHFRATQFLIKTLLGRLSMEHHIEPGKPFLRHGDWVYVLKFDKVTRSITIIRQHERNKEVSKVK